MGVGSAVLKPLGNPTTAGPNVRPQSGPWPRLAAAVAHSPGRPRPNQPHRAAPGIYGQCVVACTASVAISNLLRGCCFDSVWSRRDLTFGDEGWACQSLGSTPNRRQTDRCVPPPCERRRPARTPREKRHPPGSNTGERPVPPRPDSAQLEEVACFGALIPEGAVYLRLLAYILCTNASPDPQGVACVKQNSPRGWIVSRLDRL
ncbi:hypothetical protein NDU88_005515 [Pleurodeles waltl]|uniref:Uncharacterized protein n=1 Tax=Pleurodeles waltl TaxID=8319 RepID=A0AAV7UJ22_PLEWA|nr:hypothetical protein NDU88_005515 [Pleurodeles waltl]